MTFPFLPPPPSTERPAAFAAEGDAFFGAIPEWAQTLADYGNAISLGFTASSSTSVVVPTAGASVSLTVEPGKGYAIGMRVLAAATAAPSTQWFFATVTAYNATTGVLSMSVDFAVGAGTVATWQVTVSQPYVTAPGAGGSSTTSLAMPAIGASVSLTASTLRTWQVGDTLQVVSTANPATTRFVGTVTAYNSGTGALTLTVVDTLGTGTVASWAISPGVSPAQGVNGTSTTSLAMPAVGASVSLTASTLRTWQVGDTLQVVSTANPATTRFVGTVTAYNSGTGALTLTVVWVRGTGTIATWTITPTVNDVVLNQWTAINSAASVTLDLTTAAYFTRTVNGATTFAFAGQPTGQAFGFTLEVVHTSGAITWPSAVVWPEGIAPQLNTGRVHVFAFITDDGGTRWRGAALTNYTS